MIRNVVSGIDLDTFLVFAVGTVLVTRAYLAATGYPQIGFIGHSYNFIEWISVTKQCFGYFCA